MSTIAEFYNSTFIVSRMANVPGTRTDAVSTVSSGNRGFVHPVTERAKLYDENNWGREYRLYCLNSIDIKLSDNLTVDSKHYVVGGFVDYVDVFEGVDDHQCVVIVLRTTNA